jgi:hypothetical protein
MGLERVETGLLCPGWLVLPLARTTVSLLGLLLDVQPASLLGPKTLHRAPGVSVTLDGCGMTSGVDPLNSVPPRSNHPPSPNDVAASPIQLHSIAVANAGGGGLSKFATRMKQERDVVDHIVR